MENSIEDDGYVADHLDYDVDLDDDAPTWLIEVMRHQGQIEDLDVAVLRDLKRKLGSLGEAYRVVGTCYQVRANHYRRLCRRRRLPVERGGAGEASF
jgi:hypothetical protein